ncbi:MAG: YARHG domain-containing protein [Prevotella sp.]|nr:YARHG domain-containing protein [Prevotella sp.]
MQLRNYFNSQWWTPRRNEIPAGEFNKYENYNIKSLHNYE